MDPRKYGPQQRQARLSPLMKAKRRAVGSNQVVNKCPFGCKDHQIDHHGYCYHLVGITDNKKTLEPMELKGGFRQVNGKKRQRIKDGDRLVRITNNWRVYRDVEMPEGEREYLEAAGSAAEVVDVEEDEFTFREKKANPKSRSSEGEEEVEIDDEGDEEVEIEVDSQGGMDERDDPEAKAKSLVYKGGPVE